MKKIMSFIIGALAVLTMVIQPTSFTTTQTANADSTFCIENPSAPECMSIPMCAPNAYMPCTSTPNACGETMMWTNSCEWICMAIPPIPADTNENGTPDCTEPPICVENEWDICQSESNACGAFGQWTVQCNGSCNAIMPTAEDINENSVADCLEPDMTLFNVYATPNADIPGSQMIFSIWYQNLTNFIANNVKITYTLPANTNFVSSSSSSEDTGGVVTLNLGDVAGNTSNYVNMTIATTEAHDYGSVLHTFTISSDVDTNSENNIIETYTTIEDPFVDVWVNKFINRKSKFIAPGSEVTYMIEYGNNGNTTAGESIITDTLPAWTTFVSSSVTPTTNASGVLTWNVWTIAPDRHNESLGLIYVTVSTVWFQEEDSITNVADILSYCNEVVYAEYVTTVENLIEIPVPLAPEATIPCDNNPPNNTSSYELTFRTEPTVDLSIVKTANVSSIVAWGQITYTLSYSNVWNQRTENRITVSDLLPEWTTFVSSSVEPAGHEGNYYYWEVNWLDAGQTWSITVTVSTSGLPTGRIVNTGTIDMNCYDYESRSMIIPVEINYVSHPIYIWSNCDNNSENDQSAAAVNIVVAWGGFGWGQGGWGGWSAPTPPQLLETWAPSTGTNNTWNTNTWEAAPQDPYTFAKENGITTVELEDARLDAQIIRGEVAKMISRFYTNVLKKTIVHIDACKPENYSDYDTTDEETRWYIYDACSVGLMGWKNDKSVILDAFRPSAFITKAEFAAILSRMLYNTQSDNNSETWFQPHVDALLENGIIQSFSSPNTFEIRWNVLDMILKASNIMK